MKKIIFALIINFVCLNFSFGQSDDVQMYDIYTPLGSSVKTYLMYEAATSTREYYDDYYSSRYPNAEMIIVYDGLSSTRKFNCHGYAWLRVEQGIDRWIGYDWSDMGTYPDVYITDGSYTQVSSETFPGKVFWDRPYGDHTAITTEEPGWFISKWNQFPLFRHRWDDSPYGTAFKYYVKNCPPVVNLINQPVTTDTTVTSCGDINVQNVKVQNNAKLTLEAPGAVTINEPFEVTSNSQLEVRAVVTLNGLPVVIGGGNGGIVGTGTPESTPEGTWILHKIDDKLVYENLLDMTPPTPKWYSLTIDRDEVFVQSSCSILLGNLGAGSRLFINMKTTLKACVSTLIQGVEMLYIERLRDADYMYVSGDKMYVFIGTDPVLEFYRQVE